jgi:hypothetical protein
MAERRYTEEEVARIIERAAESQQTKRQLPAGEGLTLTELQEIGRDVGIAPELVSEAARSLDAPPQRGSRRWLGLPIGVSRTIELDRRLSESEWERLVVDLRETFDARGTVRSDGNFRQWTNGNLQALVEPGGNGDRVRLRTIKGNMRNVIRGGLAMLGGSGVLAFIYSLTGRVQTDNLETLGILALTGLAMLTIPFFVLPSWARERRIQMDEIAARLGKSSDELPPAAS